MPDDKNPSARRGIAARIAQVAARATRTLLGLLLVAMVLLNVANALARYLFSVVLIGADELLVYSMVWMVMIGMILVTMDERHIALDFLVNRLTGRPRLALTTLHNAIIAVGAGYATVQCIEFAGRVASIGQTSMALGFPMVFAHSALVAGFAGTALVATLLVVTGAADLIAGRADANADAA
jgi:TRAP-type C4-dicarboxylate transport system permease small subunit